MAVNVQYVKSVQGLLKIFELVSISEKSNLFFIDLGYVRIDLILETGVRNNYRMKLSTCRIN